MEGEKESIKAFCEKCEKENKCAGEFCVFYRYKEAKDEGKVLRDV